MGLPPTRSDENQRRRPRESGDRLSVQWIPACAGMTSPGVIFRGAPGEEESGTGLKTFRARFLASLSRKSCGRAGLQPRRMGPDKWGPLGPEAASLQGLKPLIHRPSQAAGLKPRPSVRLSSPWAGRRQMSTQDGSERGVFYGADQNRVDHA